MIHDCCIHVFSYVFIVGLFDLKSFKYIQKKFNEFKASRISSSNKKIMLDNLLNSCLVNLLIV